MVLTLPTSFSFHASRSAPWIGRVITWLLMLAVLTAIAWAYLSNPKPGPYGQCYTSRGHAIPCELVGKPAQTQ